MFSFNSLDLQKAKENKLSFDIDEMIDLESEDYKLVENLTGKITFKLEGSFILASGKLNAPVELICDRCSEFYKTVLEPEINEAIEINDNQTYEEEIEHTNDSLHEQLKSYEQINVSDYSRQYVILDIPTKKICSENCSNKVLDELNALNDSKVDPRWEKLIAYKDKYKGD
ncbi:MAG: DUF177 domain-containing protein [Candidatus Sericytochromatia bacterium]